MCSVIISQYVQMQSFNLYLQYLLFPYYFESIHSDIYIPKPIKTFQIILAYNSN
jgi:hypothetical protein